MFKKSITLLQWWFMLPRYQLEPKRVFHLRTTVLCQYIFPAESTQQSLRGLFGYFKTKPSFKSFRRRGRRQGLLELEREDNWWEKPQSESRRPTEWDLLVDNDPYTLRQRRSVKTKVSIWKRIKCSRLVHTTQQSPVILDLCLRKIRPGKSCDYRDVTVFEKFRFHNDFRPHEYEKTAFSNSSSWKGIFEKLRFRAGLVWTLGLTGEIKLRFQIPLT